MRLFPIATILVSTLLLISCLRSVVHSPEVIDLMGEINSNETAFQATLSRHYNEVNLQATTNEIDTVKARELFERINLKSNPARYQLWVFKENQQLDFMMYHTGNIIDSKIYLLPDYEF